MVQRAIRSATGVALAGVALSLIGCGGDDDDDTGCPTCLPQFKIKLAPTSQPECLAVRCATPAFLGDGVNECYATQLPTGCQCYEGQTRSCDTASTGWPKQMCSAASGTCGVNFCVVSGIGSAATSNWESACHTFP